MKAFPLLLLLAGCVVDLRGDSLRCPVHDVRLCDDTVRVIYGEPSFDGTRHEAASREFPFEGAAVMGGCVVGPSSPGWARIRFCPACRKAGRAWDLRRERAKMDPR